MARLDEAIKFQWSHDSKIMDSTWLSRISSITLTRFNGATILKSWIGRGSGVRNPGYRAFQWSHDSKIMDSTWLSRISSITLTRFNGATILKSWIGYSPPAATCQRIGVSMEPRF